MTMQLYDTGAEELMTAEIDLIADTITALLMKNTYTPNFSTDVYRDDIASHVASAVNLSSKSVAGGVFDSADPSFSAVTGGQVCNGVVLCKNTGVEATSTLIWYVGGSDIVNAPITTSGGNVDAAVDPGPYKWFSLTP